MPAFTWKRSAYTCEMVLAVGILLGVFIVGGSILVYCNQNYSDLRTSVALGKDIFIGFFSVTGILVAAESLRQSALSARTSVALRLIERWNDPKLDAVGTSWHKLREQLEGKTSNEVVERVANSNQTVAAGALNFLEEISAAVNSKAAEERQILSNGSGKGLAKDSVRVRTGTFVTHDCCPILAANPLRTMKLPKSASGKLPWKSAAQELPTDPKAQALTTCK